MSEQTIATVMDALEGIKKNMATKTEVIEVINQKLKQDEEKQKAAAAEPIKILQSQLDEARAAANQMAIQIKQLLRTRFASIRTPDGCYNGIWGNHEMAKNFGLYVLSEVYGLPAAKKSFDALGIERWVIVGDKVKALSIGDNTAGAILVPQEFIPILITLIENYGVFRRNAQDWPMSSDSASAPYQTSDVEVYCPAAGIVPSASSIGTKPVGLNAKEWVTYVLLDRNLEEDAAIAIGEVVGRSIARAFAKKEDQCGLIGDGTSTYFNYVGAGPALLKVHATPASIAGLQIQATAGLWSAIVMTDFLGVVGRSPDYADDGIDNKWYCNKNFYTTVMLRLALAMGGATAQEAIMTGYTRTPQFLNRPVEYAHVMPRVKPAADHIPALLANLRLGAYLGDRHRLSIEQSREAKFLERQIAIMGTERIAITNFGTGKDTATDPNAEAGPICALLGDIA